MSKLTERDNLNDAESGKFLLELYQKALLLPERELYEYFLNHAVSVTGSAIGFFHFVSDDQKSIILTTWNREALKNCSASYETHYPIDQAGNWADCVRLSRPIIYNVFGKSPNQKGLPEGHVPVTRIMSIPILENGKVQIIFGVGNKTDPYNKSDVIQLEVVANELNKILKQRRSENTLRESEEKYRSLFENMLDGFAYCKMVFNDDGKPVDFVYLEINDAFERLTGLKRETVVGRRVTEAIPGTEKANPELFEIYGRVATTGTEEKFEIFFMPLGKWFSISVYCPQKGYFAAVFEDTTERKQIQAKLEEYANQMERIAEERAKKLKDAERLATIGATAGMVGHDIRNPLQSIIGDLYLANAEMKSLPDSEAKTNLRESLDEICKSANYMNKIVLDLQDYAKPLKPVVQETDIENVVADLLRNSVPESVNVSSTIAKDAKKIMTDPEMLKRILFNLATNAVQAMPDGGKLTINAFCEEKTIVIMFQDSGLGIPAEDKEKLFTPLFTTKPKGQGFGLAIVKRMTEALNGTITYESEKGKGTTFIIRLPSEK